MNLPSLIERCGAKVCKCAGFHLSAFFHRVQVHLELHPCVEGLAVGGQARDTHKAQIVDLEDSLEVAIDCHELRGQPRVRGDRDAVLALHRNHRVAVVFILYALRKEIRYQRWIVKVTGYRMPYRVSYLLLASRSTQASLANRARAPTIVKFFLFYDLKTK